jgi:hypothetical protein
MHTARSLNRRVERETSLIAALYCRYHRRTPSIRDPPSAPWTPGRQEGPSGTEFTELEALSLPQLSLIAASSQATQC